MEITRKENKLDDIRLLGSFAGGLIGVGVGIVGILKSIGIMSDARLDMRLKKEDPERYWKNRNYMISKKF